MPQESKRRKTGLDGREKDEVLINAYIIYIIKRFDATNCEPISLHASHFVLQAAALESLLFNQSDAHVAQLGRESEYQLGDAHAFGAEPSQRGDASGLLAVFEERQPQVQPDGKPQAAWADSDDENVQVAVVQRARLRKLRETEDEETLTGKEYEKRLRQQHKKLNPRASWATVQPESAAQETALDGLLTQAGGLLTGSRHLPPGQLEATRLKDANHEDPSKSVVNSIEFHPNGQLVMAAGLDRRLRFFNVDGVDNPRVQSIFLEDMPVHKAAFSGGGAQVIVTGRRSFFYVLDLETANIERVVGIFGRDERSFESFAASPAAPGQ